MSRIADDYKNWTNNGYVFNNVSDRPRNPANRADPFEVAAMDFYRANPTAKERMQPIAEDNGKRWFHYTSPIWVEGYCLRCHGAEAEAPESIRKTYPGVSYGYQEGDLRGVMSIPDPQPDAAAMLAVHQQVVAVFHQLQQLPGLAALDTISLGMTADLASAIAAGSTMVRVGSGIFGARS